MDVCWGAPVLESIEHSLPEKALDDRPMAGIAVLFKLSCRPAFGGLAGTCVIDLYAGVSTTPVEIMVEDKM